MLIAIVGTKGSPGATTFALALSLVVANQGRHAVLVEADEDGGDLAIRLCIPAEPGLVAFAADNRHGYDAETGVSNSARNIAQRLALITAPPKPSLAKMAIEQSAQSLVTHTQRSSDVVHVVDCGRLRSDSVALPLVGAAHRILVVCRPSADSALHLEGQLSGLALSSDRAQLVVVGDRPSSPDEVKDLLRLPLAAMLPLEARAVEMLYSGAIESERLRRRLYMRAVAVLAQQMLADAPQSDGPQSDVSGEYLSAVHS